MAAQWYWHDGIVWNPYAAYIAQQLQNAQSAGLSSVTVLVGGNQYDVDLARLVQRNCASGFERAVWCGPNPPAASPANRFASTYLQKALQSVAWPIDLAPDGLPNYWVCRPTGGLLKLDPASAEATAVIDRWKKVGFNINEINPSRIKSICRVEHVQRWLRYQHRKTELHQMIPDSSPEGGGKELHLFHGSDRQSVKQILECGEGIDASLCARALYGRGAYFALSPTVSDRYTQPDFQGERHIILCRVLVGRMRLGTRDILTKPADCDTTVNADLEIFCKFDNCDKYEEYVISYT